MTSPSPLPSASVGVVVPTRDRRELVRRAVDAVVAQDWPGRVEVVVVYDGTEPDLDLVASGDRPVRVVANDRTPGLAGARNCGILALDTDLVAFCDDDDVWAPAKLTRQVERALEADTPVLVSSGITVVFGGERSYRTLGAEAVTYERLTRSRPAMLHSSTFLFRRDALLDDDLVGLVDETAPDSQNEDTDILMRAAAVAPVPVVDVPLVDVHWGASSNYARAWASKTASFHWLMAKHPAIERDRRGRARLYGQIAFGEAAQGHRVGALRWVGRVLRSDPLQWRTLPTLLVAIGLVRAESVMNFLHRFGRGV